MPFIYLINAVLTIYMWIVIIGVVLSWLVTFNVVNAGNQLVETIHGFCKSLTEPVLQKIRGVIPPVNGIDLSPLVLILAIGFVQMCLWWYVAPLFYSY